MDEKQFEIICKKLDKISGMIAIKDIANKDDKIATLKELGFSPAELDSIIKTSEIGIKEARERIKKGEFYTQEEARKILGV